MSNPHLLNQFGIYENHSQRRGRYETRQVSGNQSDIKGIRATRGPAFAVLHYAYVSDHVVMMQVKSTSGLSTALALPPTAGSNNGTAALMLPHGTADLEFEAQPIAIRELAVYPGGSSRPRADQAI
jgi:hypothetical protein